MQPLRPALMRFVRYRRPEDAVLATLTDLALVLMYMTVTVIKACNVSPAACRPYGLGDDPKGVFLFFLFFGLSMLLLQLIFEIAYLVHTFRKEMRVRAIRVVGTGRRPEMSLADNQNYHLFLSRAPRPESNRHLRARLRCHSRAPPKDTPTLSCACADVWSTGQDAVATIKRQLQLLIYNIRVFLEHARWDSDCSLSTPATRFDRGLASLRWQR